MHNTCTFGEHLSPLSLLCTVGYYVGVFAYTTMCTIVAGILAGSMYDCLRRRYAGIYMYLLLIIIFLLKKIQLLHHNKNNDNNYTIGKTVTK